VVEVKARGARSNGAAYDRILLIRTDRVGDLVLSTPAIASFRKSWPRAHITAVVTAYTEPVLRHNPDVDEIVIVPRAQPAVACGLVKRAGRGAQLAVGLAPRTDDIVLTKISGAPERIGYVYRRRILTRLLARTCLTQWCLSEADPDVSERFPDRPVLHEVHQVLALVRLAGGTQLTEDLTLNLGPDDVAWARANAPAGAALLALAPRWFAHNFGPAAVGKLITALADVWPHVVVTYGPETSGHAQRLRARPTPANVTWLGSLPLLHWAAVVAQSAVVITVDTGATHVAAALRRPVVVVFEREYFTLCSQEWGPWRVPHAVLCKPAVGEDPHPLIERIVAASREL
jgi:ADP-heptose:LPS heptosyltransferase